MGVSAQRIIFIGCHCLELIHSSWGWEFPGCGFERQEELRILVIESEVSLQGLETISILS